jgi:hypothetical protein
MSLQIVPLKQRNIKINLRKTLNLKLLTAIFRSARIFVLSAIRANEPQQNIVQQLSLCLDPKSTA